MINEFIIQNKKVFTYDKKIVKKIKSLAKKTKKKSKTMYAFRP